MMRDIIILAVLFLVNCVPTTADEVNHRKLVSELLVAYEVENSVVIDVEDMVNNIVSNQPQLTPYRDVLIEFLSKYLVWESLRPLFFEYFMKEIPEEELPEILKFLSSSAFKVWIESEVEVNDLPDKERNEVTEFIMSKTGEHFFDITENLTSGSIDFIGKVLTEHGKELDEMIAAETQRLVE